jgi:hypothetical protein
MAGTFRYVPSIPAFQMLNGSGTVIADSRDKILRVTDVLQGTVSFGLRTPPLDLDTTTIIGSCNASSTVVLGNAKLSFPNGDNLGSSVPASDWFCVGGSYVHMFGTGTFQTGANVNSIVTYSFQASGGTVSVRERVTMPTDTTGTGQTFPWNGVNITYELWIATFT